MALSSVYLELQRTREEIPVPALTDPRPSRTERVTAEIGSLQGGSKKWRLQWVWIDPTSEKILQSDNKLSEESS